MFAALNAGLTMSASAKRSTPEFLGSIDQDGVLSITLTSSFGIDEDGTPYFNVAGVDSGEAAWPSIDDDGIFSLITFTGSQS